MTFSGTALFYAVFGVGVAVAAALERRPAGPVERSVRIASVFLFWPLYLPMLLQRPQRPSTVPIGRSIPSATDDFWEQAIGRTERELVVARHGCVTQAGQNGMTEPDQFAELRAAWRRQAARIRQLEELLQKTTADEPVTTKSHGGETGGDAAAAATQGRSNALARQCELARQENIARLRDVHQRLSDELTGSLALVRELITRIHLARYTDAPPSSLDDLLAQIAVAMDGRTESTSAPKS